MKKNVISIVLITMLTLATSAQAELSFAQKISYDLAKSILGAVAGKSIEKLLGEDAITKEDLNRSLDEHFSKFGDSLYGTKVQTLKEAVADFSPVEIDIQKLSEEQLDASMLASISLKIQSIEAVIHATQELSGTIEMHINENNFWKVMPTYIYLENIRLAFFAEKHALDPKGGWDKVMASRAANAIYKFRTYWIDYMARPEGNLGCLYKERSQTYFSGMNLTGQSLSFNDTDNIKLNALEYLKRYEPFIEMRVCNYDNLIAKINKGMEKERRKATDFNPAPKAPSTAQIKSDLPNRLFFNHKHVFNSRLHTNQWWFVYNKSGSGNQHWIYGPVDSREEAKAKRFQLTFHSYTSRLGPVKNTIRHWYEIAVKLGTESTKAAAKERYAKYY